MHLRGDLGKGVEVEGVAVVELDRVQVEVTTQVVDDTAVPTPRVAGDIRLELPTGVVADVETGKFTPRISNVTFSLDEFHADIDGTNAKLTGALHGH